MLESCSNRNSNRPIRPDPTGNSTTNYLGPPIFHKRPGDAVPEQKLTRPQGIRALYASLGRPESVPPEYFDQFSRFRRVHVFGQHTQRRLTINTGRASCLRMCTHAPTTPPIPRPPTSPRQPAPGGTVRVGSQHMNSLSGLTKGAPQIFYA